MTALAVRESPPLNVVLPFFLAAPLGLIAAGIMLALAGDDSVTAVTTPELLAATHGAVLGWISLTIMGALLQLGPVLLGGRLISHRLARVQLWLHVAGVGLMLLAFQAWRTEALVIGGSLTALSFALFLVNALPAVRWFARGSLVRNFVSVSLLFLMLTVAAGFTYVLTLHYGWFPITAGRVAAHAHLGLAGFLALMLMGVSFQLVPMFQLAPHDEPKFGRHVLVWMSAATVVFAAAFWADPPPALRLVAAAALGAGALFWMYDIAMLLHRRAKRKLDIQAKGTLASLIFLGLAIATGVIAASGWPESLVVEHQRLQLAYAVLAIGGWAGGTLIGNSFKVVPFLIWNARYRELAGKQPVPTLAELLDLRLANAALATLCLAVATGAASGALGWLEGLRMAGVVFAAAGCLQMLTLLLVAVRRPQARAAMPTPARRIQHEGQ